MVMVMPMADDRVLKPIEVAQRLNVHRDTVMLWLRSGVLPGFQLPGGRYWRMRESALDAWIAQREADTAAAHDQRLPTPDERPSKRPAKPQRPEQPTE
jgi:excisionase family DNA binding protein